MRPLQIFASTPVTMSEKSPLRVVITGAAGQIAYSLIYQVASGYVFGADQPLVLHLLDIAPMMGVLNGVVMEIHDCAMPLVHDVVATDDPNVAFKDIDAAFLVGAMPRKEGMERKDLLAANVKIFKVQGEALDKFAKKSVKVGSNNTALLGGAATDHDVCRCWWWATPPTPTLSSAATTLHPYRRKISLP